MQDADLPVRELAVEATGAALGPDADVLAATAYDLALRRIEISYATGTGEAELARLEARLIDDPMDVVAMTAQGALLERLGRREEAIELLEAACDLAPNAPRPAGSLAQILVRTDQMIQAERVLRRAIALAPDDAALERNHPPLLSRLHRHGEAREKLLALLDRDGPSINELCNLSNALVSIGEQEAGVAAARQAIAVEPGSHLAWRTYSTALLYADGTTGEELLSSLRECSALLQRSGAASFGNAPARGRKLRIGLLSLVLRTHPVGWLTIAGFEALDPDAFEIICFAQAPSSDALQQRFQAIAAQWHIVDGMARAEVVSRIRASCIDILIDLGGYGDRGLLPVCALRPAPVIIKWVGSQASSTGLAEMDWFMTDRWETPAELEPSFTERLLRLADGYVCYSSPAYAPDVSELPACSNGYVTFGCFNNLAKITPRTIGAWCRILNRVPRSRLVLKHHALGEASVRDRMRRRFTEHGLDPSRLELRATSSHRALLAQYRDIDIVLDPFPYSGGLTTCEALLMGVPTVTMPGHTFASRHSASHLSNVGLDDWIAADIDGYEDIALGRSADLASLASLRRELRSRMKCSPLCDTARFGRSLTAALRAAWADWCDHQEPVD